MTQAHPATDGAETNLLAGAAAPPSAAKASAPAGAGKSWRSWGARALAYGAAGLVLFTTLNKSGIWDPYELDAADLARRIALRVFGATALELPGMINTMPTLTDLKMGELPFTSMAVAFRLFGLHEWTGRLALAVWAFAGVVALYEFLARIVDRRAGLYAALALVTMPLYFVQARTMLGDVVTMVAFSFGFFGLAGALLDDGIASRVGWLSLGLLGLFCGELTRGVLLGVAAPALGVGLGWLVLRCAEPPSSPRKGQRDAFGALAVVIGAVALGVGLLAFHRAQADGPVARSVGFALLKKAPTEATFDLVVRQLGHGLFPWSAFLPFALGRLLRAPVEVADGSSPATEDRELGVRVTLLVGLAVAYVVYALLAPFSGALPFSAPALFAAVIALAVLDFERGAPPSRAVAVGTLMLGAVLLSDMVQQPDKALVAFAVDKPQFPKSFEGASTIRLSAVIALFCGLVGLTWFEAQPAGPPPSLRAWARGLLDDAGAAIAELASIWNGNLLFGLVVVEAALVGLAAMIFVGKRAAWAPVVALSDNFGLVGMNTWWAVPAVLVLIPVLMVATRDAFRRLVTLSRLSRASFTVVAAVLTGSLLAFSYYPALASQLSPKEVFETYKQLHKPGEALGTLGVRGRAGAYYEAGEVTAFTDVQGAFDWLNGTDAERRWLVVKSDDLPRLNALYRVAHAKNLPILDGRSSEVLLASNQLGGQVNQNWLVDVVLDTPRAPAHAVDAQFEDQLETLGWDVVDKSGALVDSVVPATAYRMRFYYRVLRPVTGAWKAFVHIDGFQRRFNGDHAVLDGKYPMNLWGVGDVVVDELAMKLEPNFTPGDYAVYYGFFSGEQRFKVTRGTNNENRVMGGSLRVR